jgi:hypothetical protein
MEKNKISYEDYKNKLTEISIRQGVGDKVIFIGPTSYSKVMENARTCHIGVGIHRKQDVMNKTLGTSSNKIYEYAASGLPVLLYDNDHFRHHLGKYKWAFFTDCTKHSLVEAIKNIILDYAYLSGQARQDFLEQLNFEKYFDPLINYLQNSEIKD